ncbi:MAG: NAD-dependent epimerase/dehydratase family protein, partial [Limisphaerales bacterium]
LVTGGAGFIGSHIVEYFHEKAAVRVLDNLRSGFKRNLAGLQYEFFEGSVLDRDLVRRAMSGVEYVFHLAAMVSVPASMQAPIECNEINVRGTLLVLEAAAAAGVKKLVFSSSASVYGEDPEVPKLETMPPRPKSPYAITKLDGEFYCRLFSEQGRLATTCLRYFNVFGPRQDPKNQYAAAIPIFVDRALKNEPMTIFGDGQQTRDFIHVRDVVAANVFFATKSSETGVFNVASGKHVTINELAENIRALTGSRSEIRRAPERAGDIRQSWASIDKICGAGFVPENHPDNLRGTIDWFRKETGQRPAAV